MTLDKFAATVSPPLALVVALVVVVLGLFAYFF